MGKTIRKGFGQKKDTPEESVQPVSEPFAFAGWPDYINPEWPEGYQRTQGISFEIGKGCFGKKDPLLFYRDYGRGIDDEKLYMDSLYALQMDLKHSEMDAPHDYRPQMKIIRF